MSDFEPNPAMHKNGNPIVVQPIGDDGRKLEKEHNGRITEYASRMISDDFKESCAESVRRDRFGNVVEIYVPKMKMRLGRSVTANAFYVEYVGEADEKDYKIE